jgi:hypothetical protein
MRVIIFIWILIGVVLFIGLTLFQTTIQGVVVGYNSTNTLDSTYKDSIIYASYNAEVMLPENILVSVPYKQAIFPRNYGFRELTNDELVSEIARHEIKSMDYAPDLGARYEAKAPALYGLGKRGLFVLISGLVIMMLLSLFIYHHRKTDYRVHPLALL